MGKRSRLFGLSTESRPPPTVHGCKIPMWVTAYRDFQYTRLPVLNTGKSQVHQDKSVTLNPRKINTTLHRPRVQKTFAVRAVGNLLLSTHCRTPRFTWSENFTRCELSALQGRQNISPQGPCQEVGTGANLPPWFNCTLSEPRQGCLSMRLGDHSSGFPSEAGVCRSTTQTCYSSLRTAVMRNCVTM